MAANCFIFFLECKENVGRINGGLVHALYDYTSENDDELSFYCGDELTVLRRGDTVEKEWWWGRDRKGNTGYIPCNLVGVSGILLNVFDSTKSLEKVKLSGAVLRFDS